MTEIQYRLKKDQVLSKFNPDFIKKHYRTDANFNRIIEMLVRDADPYSIIEELITGRIELLNQIENYLELHAQSRIIPCGS